MPSRKPPSDVEYRQALEQSKRQSTLQVLFKVARLLDELAVARLAERHAAPGLRRSHTSLLPHIDLNGTRITDLADRLGISKQAVSQLVDDLEKLGVLARLPDPDDARARRVTFTELGRKGLLEGLEVLRTLEQELALQVGRERMQGLREALLSIHDYLEHNPRT
ncbi:MAG: MarR family winged helix-turn-helix transcriptional regulator [Myxococcota bacterium]